MASGLPSTARRRFRHGDRRAHDEHHPRTPPSVTETPPEPCRPVQGCKTLAIEGAMGASQRHRSGPWNSAAKVLPPCAPLKGHRPRKTQARGGAAGYMQGCGFVTFGALDLAAVVAGVRRRCLGGWFGRVQRPRSTLPPPPPPPPPPAGRREGVCNAVRGVLSRPHRVARTVDDGDAKGHATLDHGATALEMAIQPPPGAPWGPSTGALCLLWQGEGRRSGRSDRRGPRSISLVVNGSAWPWGLGPAAEVGRGVWMWIAGGCGKSRP